MCGITGYFGEGGEEKLVLMINRISHRGPDQEGMFISEGVGLGFRRLAINHIAKGKQPYETDSSVVIFNGEIYNFNNLVQDFFKEDNSFENYGEVELIAKLYEQKGIESINLFDGMFSIAIFDKLKKKLFLVRDPIGIKPLYFIEKPEVTFFSSEIKSFIDLKILTEINMQFLQEKNIFGFPLNDSTLFKDVRKVLPGEVIMLDKSGIRSRRDIFKENPCSNGVKDVLIESIKKRHFSEVPINILLSGGIDSAIIANYSKSYSFVSIGTNKKSEDLFNANKLSAFMGESLDEIIIDKEFTEKDLDKYLYALEDFDYESVILFLIFSELKGKTKVTLSGHGADELFLGYQIYKKHKLFLDQVNKRLENTKEYISEYNYLRYKKILLKISDFNEFVIFIQDQELPNIQLDILDKLSMWFSIENRVPFLSRQMFEIIRKIPLQDLNTLLEKRYLRKLFDEELPKFITQRRKLMSGRSTTPTVILDIESMALKWFENKNESDFLYIKFIENEELFSMFEDNIEESTKKFGVSKNLRNRVITKLFCIEKLKLLFLEDVK